MKNSMCFSGGISAALFLFFLFISCQQAPCPSFSGEDIDQIKGLIEQSEETFNEGNISAFVDRYAEDAILMAPENSKLVGKDAIRQWMNGTKMVSVHFNVEEVIGSCNLANVAGTYEMHAEEGGLLDRGRWLEVWNRVSAGTWILIREVYVSDIPSA